MADDRPLGERELDGMAVPWAHGSGTVGEVPQLAAQLDKRGRRRKGSS